MGLCQTVPEKKKKHILEVLKNYADLLENCYSGVFGVANYISLFRLKKFKMADLIWWSRFIKIDQIYLTKCHFIYTKKSKFLGLCNDSNNCTKRIFWEIKHTQFVRPLNSLGQICCAIMQDFEDEPSVFDGICNWNVNYKLVSLQKGFRYRE